MKDKLLAKAPPLRRAVLLVAITGVPLVFLRAENDPISVPKLALLIACIVVAILLRLAEMLQGARTDGLRRLLVPAATVTAGLLVGWLFSPYRLWSLLGEYQRYQGLLPYLLVVLLGVLVADAFEGRLRQVAWALVIAGAIAGLYGVIQVLGIDPIEWPTPGDASSTLGNPNFTGGFLGIVLPLTVWLWLVEPERRPLMSVLAVSVVAGWIVSFSQGGWAAGAAGLAVGGGLWLSKRGAVWRVLGLAAAVVIALAVVGQVLLGIVDRASPLVPGTVLLRAEAWEGAVDMAKDSPIVGRGPNAFAIEGAHHRTPEDAARIGFNYPEDPHSVPLSFLTSAGILGLLGWLVAVGWVIYRSVTRPLSRDTIPWLAALAAYLVQSLVSIDELALRTTAWAALGAFAASQIVIEAEPARAGTRKREKRRHEPLRAPIAVAALGLVALGAVAWSVLWVVADARVWQGRLLAATGRTAEAQREFESARGFLDLYEYRQVAGQGLGTFAATAEEPDATTYEAAVPLFAYLEDVPQVSSLVEHARVLFAGRAIDPTYTERAYQVYERAIGFDPHNPLLRIEAARVLVELEQPGEAIDVLKPAAEAAEVRFAASYYGAIALAEYTRGEQAAARAAADRALEIDSEEPYARAVLEQLQAP